MLTTSARGSVNSSIGKDGSSGVLMLLISMLSTTKRGCTSRARCLCQSWHSLQREVHWDQKFVSCVSEVGDSCRLDPLDTELNESSVPYTICKHSPRRNNDAWQSYLAPGRKVSRLAVSRRVHIEIFGECLPIMDAARSMVMKTSISLILKYDVQDQLYQT